MRSEAPPGVTLVDSRSASVPFALRATVVLTVGLGVGVVTSILQTYLNSPWESLVNAASPWLTPMFLVGVLWRRPSAAALAGLATGACELIGYYGTASLRGYPAGHAILLFWGLCAVIGGPVFGAGGWAWAWASAWVAKRAGARVDLGAIGAALLPASFLAEAVVAYGVRLHYWSSAILFAALGVGAILLLGFRRHQHGRIARWLLLTLPLAVAAEFILGVVYNESF
jgi:hypothetical protein